MTVRQRVLACRIFELTQELEALERCTAVMVGFEKQGSIRKYKEDYFDEKKNDREKSAEEVEDN